MILEITQAINMNSLTNNITEISQELYKAGFKKESRDVLFSAIRLAHSPLMKVLEMFGFKPTETAEYGNETSSSPSSKEIWISVKPEGSLEYTFENNSFDSAEDLISHLSNRPNQLDGKGMAAEEHSCQNDGPCLCGGSCRESKGFNLLKKTAQAALFNTVKPPVKKLSAWSCKIWSK